MAKTRVHQIAKELGLPSKVFIEKAQSLGYTHITSHANTLEQDEAKELRAKIGQSSISDTAPKTVLRRRAIQSENNGPHGKIQMILTRHEGEKTVDQKVAWELPDSISSIPSQLAALHFAPIESSSTTINPSAQAADENLTSIKTSETAETIATSQQAFSSTTVPQHDDLTSRPQSPMTSPESASSNAQEARSKARDTVSSNTQQAASESQDTVVPSDSQYNVPSGASPAVAKQQTSVTEAQHPEADQTPVPQEQNVSVQTEVAHTKTVQELSSISSQEPAAIATQTVPVSPTEESSPEGCLWHRRRGRCRRHLR
ncbi:MAG: translation initiation factor IF-2 N-terminal domain-containing protein [Myxococcota bacterium]